MKKIIEVKEISLPHGRNLDVGSYPSAGFYLVDNVYYALVANGMIMYVCEKGSADTFFKDVKESAFGAAGQQGSMSEEFILRLSAILANKEKYKEL